MPLAILACAVVIGTVGCGLESDGSHKAAESPGAGSQAMLGRYRTEAIRLGVNRPLLLLIDTATGQVFQRKILGSQKFMPITEEPGPGDNLKTKIPGRYDIKVIPGRRGSALLRLDSVTGKTWFAQLGGTQREWFELPSSLDDEREKAQILSRESYVASRSASPNQVANPGAGTDGNKPPIEAILTVLTEPGYELALRVWTASQMAAVYPAEAAELLGTSLQADDTKVMIAIIEKVEFDTDGRVRKALEGLKGHQNTAVAQAIRKKLRAPH